MITDQARNQAYNLALQAAVKPGVTPLHAVTMLVTLRLDIYLQGNVLQMVLFCDIDIAWQAPL